MNISFHINFQQISASAFHADDVSHIYILCISFRPNFIYHLSKGKIVFLCFVYRHFILNSYIYMCVIFFLINFTKHVRLLETKALCIQLCHNSPIDTAVYNISSFYWLKSCEFYLCFAINILLGLRALFSII